MKKSILSLAFIFSLNLVQAQDLKLDTSDAFEGPLSKAILDAPKPKIYNGIGYLDHSSSIGSLKSIFEDSGESFSRIFDNLPSKFPGITYSEESEIQVNVEDYYKKSIKGHSYDSIAYSVNESEIIRDGRVVKVEREKISCYNSDQIGRVRFIQISRFDGEIVHVLDNCPDLK